MKLFWDHKIPLPSLSEQNRIAKILEKADVICQKRQQAIQLVDELIRAVFLDMFGGPEANMRGWAVKPLDEYLTFLTSGSRGWAKYYSETGSKFIRIQNVSKNKLLLSDMAFVNAPQGAEANRTKVQVGDVLLSITADLGRSSVVTKDIAGGHINQHLALLRLSNERLNPRYLSAYLSSTAGINQFMKKNKSAVKAGLNFTDIKTLEVPVPPIAEQLSYEKTYDKAISLQVEQFRSLEEAKKSFGALSQKAFTGKL
jgi:type I restriction enzyme S subunit